MKKILNLFLILILLSSCSIVSSYARTLPYENYNFSNKDISIVPAPQAYIPSTVLYGHDLGLSDFLTPTDAHVDPAGNLYILDSGNNRIIAIDKNLKVVSTFIGFSNGGQADSFSGARGFFIDKSYIYLADTEKQRIVILKKDGTFVKICNAPVSDYLGENFVFKPIRIAVDSDGLLYIVGDGTFEGIITMDIDGNFAGFIGANYVSLSAWDIFWRRFSTVTQKNNMIQYVPVDLSSLDIDKEGFIYCTTYTAQSSKLVKRLNPAGDNVIRNLSNVPLTGDPDQTWYGSLKGLSTFKDVSAGENGIYACLDNNRGKIFCYDNDGYLLYVFGGKSSQNGGFSDPVALTWFDKKMVVVDKQKGSLTFFKATKYATLINDAIAEQSALSYDNAFVKWNEVLKLNCNFELAHVAVGKVYYNKGEYKKALTEFKMGNNKSLYSKAFNKYRAEWIYANIQKILIIILSLIALFFIFKIYRFIIKKKQS